MDIESKPDNFISRHSLRLSGAFNLIGDALFIAEGKEKKDNYKKVGGVLYTLGGINLATYGDADKKTQIHVLEEKLTNFIEQEICELPQGSELLAIKHYHQVGKVKLQDELHQNPATNTLSAYTAGAIPMAISGIKTYKAGNGWGDMAYGLSSVALKTASWFIPEDNAHDNNKKQGGIIGWVKEKPLRLMGYGSLISDAFIGAGAYQKAQKGEKYIIPALTSASYLAADFLIAASHKDIANNAEKLTTDEQGRINHLVSEIIESQPDDKKEAALDKIAAFLTEQPAINGDAKHIIASIQADILPDVADNNIIAADWTGKLYESSVNNSIA